MASLTYVRSGPGADTVCAMARVAGSATTSNSSRARSASSLARMASNEPPAPNDSSWLVVSSSGGGGSGRLTSLMRKSMDLLSRHCACASASFFRARSSVQASAFCCVKSESQTTMKRQTTMTENNA